MKRNFDEWLSTFRESISGYDYYVDFKKVFENVDSIKVQLCILNSLIGSKNIRQDFINLLAEYPELLQCIPILLAVRTKEIFAMDEKGAFLYNFKKESFSPEQYADFMEKTGLFDLLSNHIISNLIDYVTGVETGLDSNGRKNRGGHAMEDLVEKFLLKAGFIKGSNLFKEINISDIQKKFNVDMSSVSNEGKAEKRFDFAIKTHRHLYVIETNFYASSGSKLNETARSYKTLASEINGITGVSFVWFTDGKGWNDAKHNLEETFDMLDTIYNINDLENGIATIIFK